MDVLQVFVNEPGTLGQLSGTLSTIIYHPMYEEMVPLFRDGERVSYLAILQLRQCVIVG